MKKNIQKILQENPAFVGFFAFSISLISWLWLLQILSRLIFIVHKNEHVFQYKYLVISASFHGFILDFAWMSYLCIAVFLFVLIAAITNIKKLAIIGKYLLLIVTACTFFISFADAELFHVWGSKFNLQAREFLNHPTEAMASSANANWFIAVTVTLLLTGGMYWLLIKVYRWLANFQDRRFKTAIMALLGMVIMAPWVRGGLQTVPINQSSAYFSTDPFKNAAGVNSCWNLMYYFIDQEDAIPAEKLLFGSKDTGYFHQYAQLQPDTFPKLSTTEKPNVVLFILESFSSHTSAFFGSVNNHTPFLDSLAKSGLSFTHAYAQGDRTSKGLAAILSAWPGQANKSKTVLSLPSKSAKLPNLGKIASSKGYFTSFYYGGDLSFDNMRAYLLSGGFRNIYGEEIYGDEEKGSKWGAHDEFVFQKVVRNMKKAESPFFTCILSLSSHEPFEIPGKSNSGSETQKFLNSVKYTDDCIRNFIQSARSEAWFSNTVFVFVADHGRKMDLENMEPHQPKFFEIPIIFWGMPLKTAYKGKTEARICSQTDIPLTISQSIFNVANNPFLFGRNLLTPQKGVSVYQFWDGFGVVSDSGHVVWNNTGASVVESNGNYLNLLNLGKVFQYKSVNYFNDL